MLRRRVKDISIERLLGVGASLGHGLTVDSYPVYGEPAETAV
jgi:hypothetical protein